MAQKKRGKSRRAQRPRPPGTRPGRAGTSANGREQPRPELNGDVADPLADAAAELDEREAALERERTPQADAAVPSDDLAPAPADEADDVEADEDADEEEFDEAPSALEHATPDVEIAEAQIALGAREASEFDETSDEDGDDESEDEEDEDEPDAPLLTSDPVLGSRPAPRARRRPSRELVEEEDEGESRTPAGAPGAPRPNPFVRLAHFVQGSWRELQRVQWPDRRQVMQATGVVIGFVIVAGVFLGVSDWLAGKLVNWILG